jgi:hypothetical protein
LPGKRQSHEFFVLFPLLDLVLALNHGPAPLAMPASEQQENGCEGEGIEYRREFEAVLREDP